MAQLTEVDASQQTELTTAQVRAFRRDGLLVIRKLLKDKELEYLRGETAQLIDQAQCLAKQANQTSLADGQELKLASKEHCHEPDFLFMLHKHLGRNVPFRIEHLVNKSTAARALLAHPFILRSVEKILGPDFIPTWDSMVFKLQGAGAAIAWHRDDDSPATHSGGPPIFNVDFYLDGSDETNCLRGIPASNQWSSHEATQRIEALNANGDFGEDASVVRVATQPGDVLLHNIHVLHGSPHALSNLRRVIYYEFRSIDVELNGGPHTPEYIPVKQDMLRRCLAIRQQQSYACNERPYVFRGCELALPATNTNTSTSFRFPHEAYWRESQKV